MRRGALTAGLFLGACFDPGIADRLFGDARVAPVDAPVLDAPVADAPPADARPADARPVDAAPQMCLPGCGASSCDAQTCGRSACGFDCGDCRPTPVATPCIDHYGQLLEEGQRGLRSCPGELDRFQVCTCTGGGPSAWTACGAACVGAGCSRAGQIGCGYESCLG